MPDLNTMLHLKMLNDYKKSTSFLSRIRKAINILFTHSDIYGLEWGDPEMNPPLNYVKSHFLLPYLNSETTLIEIGPGGGRWTRYMLHVKNIYAVDYHQELLHELSKNFSKSNIHFILNHGDDFPQIPEKSIDFVFSFGTFVHLEIEVIHSYLKNLKPLLKPTAIVVIQYADKTKPLGKSNHDFADNDPNRMRRLVSSLNYKILEEDINTMWHSSIIRFCLACS